MIALGSDHAGYELKEKIKLFLSSNKIEYIDYGTNSAESVDFPDYAKKVSDNVVNGTCNKGILICGSGIGMSIAANKVDGIRCALCSSIEAGKLSRLHNNANVLAMAGRLTDHGLAIEIAKTWINTDFLEGKYEKRNKMISDMES